VTLRLGALRRGGSGGPGTVAVRVDDDAAVEIGPPDVGALLAEPAWRGVAAAADGARHALADLPPRAWAPPVPRPGKSVCVGPNTLTHIREMGRDLATHPTLFAKFPVALLGPYDPIAQPAHESGVVD